MNHNLKDKVTISDVAAKSGYSISAVSMALSQKGRIGSEATRKILKAAEELGYLPNKTAQFLPHKTVKIGVMIPDHPHIIQNILYSGICSAVDARNDMRIHLTIYKTGYDLADRKKCLELLSRDSDGIILEDDLTENEFSSCIDTINQRECPVISLVSRIHPRIRFSSGVRINAEVVGKLAAQVLHSGGCTDAVIFSGIRDCDIHERNRSGFLEAARRYGIRLRDVFYTDDDPEKARQYSRLLKTSPYPVNGIFVSSYLAPWVCEGLTKNGLSPAIPVVGVDLYRETAECLIKGQMSAAIFQNQFAQARAAVDCVLEYIFNKRKYYGKNEPVLIKPELVLSENLECYRENIHEITDGQAGKTN